MKYFNTKILVLLFALISFSFSGYAQKNQDNNIDVLDYLSIDKDKYSVDKQLLNFKLIKNKSSVESFDPVAEIPQEMAWANPAINFTPFAFFIGIGDVNGDGIDDLTKRFFSVNDERDSDLSTQVNKSLVYYSGTNLSTDPDQILYNAIYPLGDLNGDGYADAVGAGLDGEATLYTGSETGLSSFASAQSDTLLSISQKALFVGQNLNQDKFDDIYGYYRDQNGIYKYFEVYGAPTFDIIIINEVVLPSEVAVLSNNLYRFSVNDTVYIGFSVRNIATRDYEFRTYKFVDADSIALADLKIINARIEDSFISDFDGDGMVDLLVSDNSNEFNFFKGTSNPTQLFSDDKVLVSNEFSNISIPYLLDDILGDGKSEILYVGNNGLDIVNLDNVGSAFTSIASVSANTLLFNSTLFPFFNSNYDEGFSFFSGFNTFSIPIQSDNKFGNVIFKTSNGSNSIESELLLLNYSDYSVKSRNELFHLSDLDGDGIDNFAVREITIEDEKVVIYNGINDANPSFIKISNPDVLYPAHVQAGFFDDSLNQSIAVLMRPKGLSEVQSEFRLYRPSDLTTPYFAIKHTDLSSTLNRLDIFSNIGDINNDGFDDLALSAAFSNEPEKVFIFLGGTNISSSPDITINLNEDFPNPVNGQTILGATVIQGLGDLNGDGIDDFVLGDGRRNYTSELAQKNRSISGVIYVIYGQDTETPLFDGPDVELQADTSNTDNQQWIFGGLNSVASGDFDGDGTKDIVGISLRHANSAFDNGVGALTYFFGKDGFTSQPDTTIPIRTEYVYNPDQGIEEVYSKFTGRALLKAIPDQNGDGADELLYVGNNEQRNAILYEIGANPSEIATAIYKAPNSRFGLNPAGSFINKQYLPLVGDYNGDGNINFLGYQNLDRNYRDTPIYMYEIDNVAVSIADEGGSNPAGFELKQNYPNPFNPSTKISFTIPKTDNVQITVYNILGQEVSTIVNSRFLKGSHSVNFDASHLASGIYLYRIRSNDLVSTKRMTLIK